MSSLFTTLRSSSWSPPAPTGSVHTPTDLVVVVFSKGFREGDNLAAAAALAGEQHILSEDGNLLLVEPEQAWPEHALSGDDDNNSLLVADEEEGEEGEREAWPELRGGPVFASWTISKSTWWRSEEACKTVSGFSVAMAMLSLNCSLAAAAVKSSSGDNAADDDEESGENAQSLLSSAASSSFLLRFLVPPNKRYTAVAETANAATIVSFFVSTAGSSWIQLLAAAAQLTISVRKSFKRTPPLPSIFPNGSSQSQEEEEEEALHPVCDIQEEEDSAPVLSFPCKCFFSLAFLLLPELSRVLVCSFSSSSSSFFLSWKRRDLSLPSLKKQQQTGRLFS